MADEDQVSAPPIPAGPPKDRLTTVLLVVAMLAAVGGLGVIVSKLMQTGPPDKYEVLRIATQQFIEDRVIVASKLAKDVELDPEVEADLEWIATREFLVGVGEIVAAGEEPKRRPRSLLLQEAIPHLEAASESGFPEGRQAQGYRLLGEALHEIGEFEKAVAAMRQALVHDSLLYRSLTPLIGDALLRLPDPAAEAALAEAEEYLGDQTLDLRSRRRGELVRLRALIALGKWPESDQHIRRSLERYGPDTILPEQEMRELQQFRDRVALLRGERDLARVAATHGAHPIESEKRQEAATAMLEPTVAELSELWRTADPETGIEARRLLAEALKYQGRLERALIHLTNVRLQRPFGPQSIAAGLSEIELLARRGRGDEMVQAMRYVIRELGDPKTYPVDAPPLVQFKQRITDSLDALRSAGKFQHAIEAARLMPPVFDNAEAMLQEGLCFRQWAAETLAGGTGVDGKPSPSAAKIARERFRLAGEAFAKSAELDFDTERYLPTLWSAIDSNLRGRNHRECQRLLEPYLRYETRIRRPRGLVMYGRVLLSEGELDRAIEVLQECTSEYPRDPLRYDARIYGAMAANEKGDSAMAERMLKENIFDGELEPESRAFHDSQFLLGEMLYQRAYQNFLDAEAERPEERLRRLAENQPMLQEAIINLDRAVAFYPSSPRTNHAAYLAARAHAMAAQWPRLEEQSPDRLDTARRQLRKQADAEMQRALDGFVSLQKRLFAQDEERALSDRDAALVRNCMMAEADLLREMERFEEAELAYQNASGRFADQPVALEAIVARAGCLRRLGRTTEANSQIQLAGLVLSQIDEKWDDRFAELTRYDRLGWEEFLQWMADRITNQTT